MASGEGEVLWTLLQAVKRTQDSVEAVAAAQVKQVRETEQLRKGLDEVQKALMVTQANVESLAGANRVVLEKVEAFAASFDAVGATLAAYFAKRDESNAALEARVAALEAKR